MSLHRANEMHHSQCAGPDADRMLSSLDEVGANQPNWICQSLPLFCSGLWVRRRDRPNSSSLLTRFER